MAKGTVQESRGKREIKLTSLLRRRAGGQVMVIVALLVGTGVLFGFVALAVDGGGALLARRNMQNAADAAAIGAAKLLGNNVIWGPDPNNAGQNKGLYLVTDAQIKNAVAQLAAANGLLNGSGYTLQLEFGQYDGNPPGHYTWTALPQATDTDGTWNPAPDPDPTHIMSGAVDAIRVTATIDHPTAFARLIGWTSITVSAKSAAALIGDPNHIVKGPTWPMVTQMTTNDATSYLNTYGLCNPAKFYQQETTFQNLVSLAWAQGCSFVNHPTSPLDCSSTLPPDADSNGLHSQLIGWGDQRGDPGQVPGPKLEDKAGLWGGPSFSSTCNAPNWNGTWNPLGSCSGTETREWNIYAGSGTPYGTICCRQGVDVSDIDVPNWIYWDFAGKGFISPQESAFPGGTSIPGETKWAFLGNLSDPRQDYRGTDDNGGFWPPDDDIAGDWLETYDNQTNVGRNPEMVIGPVLDYIARNGTEDLLAHAPGLDYGKHVDKVMYVYKDKEVSRPLGSYDPAYCSGGPPPNPFDCAYLWRATQSVAEDQHPDRVHIVQPLKFRFYERLAENTTDWSIPLHQLCTSSPDPVSPQAGVYALIVGELLDAPSTPGAQGAHGLYNYVTFIDANQ